MANIKRSFERVYVPDRYGWIDSLANMLDRNFAAFTAQNLKPGFPNQKPAAR
jgi:hypothetical protein